MLFREEWDVVYFVNGAHDWQNILLFWLFLVLFLALESGFWLQACHEGLLQTWLEAAGAVQVIVQAAQTARIHDERFREFYERYASRKGHERGVVAVAHEMLRVVYFMLKRMEPYRGGDRGLSVRKFKRLKCKAVVGLQG